jgi:hypothetical protein
MKNLRLGFVFAVLFAGCGGKSATGVDAGADLAGGGGLPDLTVPGDAFHPHALYLGLPATLAATTGKYLRSGDWVYATDQVAAGAVGLKGAAAGARAGVLLNAGCCASPETRGYPAGIDAVIYDYEPNQSGQCQMDRCTSLPMYCAGAGGGLPANCAFEPSYKCVTSQHEMDFQAVRNAATVQSIKMWAMPAYYTLVPSTPCPTVGNPAAIQWGLLGGDTDGFFFKLDLKQSDVATTVAAAQDALDQVRAAAPDREVWAEVSLTFATLCNADVTCTTGAPATCDPVKAAQDLAAVVQALGQVRQTHGTGQLDGVLLYAQPCNKDELDAILSKLR